VTSRSLTVRTSEPTNRQCQLGSRSCLSESGGQAHRSSGGGCRSPRRCRSACQRCPSGWPSSSSGGLWGGCRRFVRCPPCSSAPSSRSASSAGRGRQEQRVTHGDDSEHCGRAARDWVGRLLARRVLLWPVDLKVRHLDLAGVGEDLSDERTEPEAESARPYEDRRGASACGPPMRGKAWVNSHHVATCEGSTSQRMFLSGR
jgi:hypothetical protein